MRWNPFSPKSSFTEKELTSITSDSPFLSLPLDSQAELINDILQVHQSNFLNSFLGAFVQCREKVEFCESKLKNLHKVLNKTKHLLRTRNFSQDYKDFFQYIQSQDELFEIKNSKGTKVAPSKEKECIEIKDLDLTRNMTELTIRDFYYLLNEMLEFKTPKYFSIEDNVKSFEKVFEYNESLNFDKNDAELKAIVENETSQKLNLAKASIVFYLFELNKIINNRLSIFFVKIKAVFKDEIESIKLKMQKIINASKELETKSKSFGKEMDVLGEKVSKLYMECLQA